MGAGYRHSWLRSAGPFGGVPSPILAETLWLLLPVIPGWGLLLGLLGWWVVPRHSWRRALRMQFPAIPGWGLLLALVGLSVANPGRGACGC